MFCGKCGTENEAEFKFCKKCRNNLAVQGRMPQNQGCIDVDPAFRDYLKQCFQLKPEEGILAVGKYNPKLTRVTEILNYIGFGVFSLFGFYFAMDNFRTSEDGGVLWGLAGLLCGCLYLKIVHYQLVYISKVKREQCLVVTTERVIGIGLFHEPAGLAIVLNPKMVPINATFDFLIEIANCRTMFGESMAILITTKSEKISFYAIENREEVMDVVQREILRCKSQ